MVGMTRKLDWSMMPALPRGRAAKVQHEAVTTYLAGHDQGEEGQVHINQLLGQLTASCKAAYTHLIPLRSSRLPGDQQQAPHELSSMQPAAIGRHHAWGGVTAAAG